MSVISKRDCPQGRQGHRYWISCGHLSIEWTEGTWDIAFVDTSSAMSDWMKKYASNILMFDCEWSPHSKKGVGLIQFATDPSIRQVLIVDCSVVDLAEVRNLFTTYQMVGWATDGDKKRLELAQDIQIRDLQQLTKYAKEKMTKDVSKIQPTHPGRPRLLKYARLLSKMNLEHIVKIQNYQPTDKNGNPHNQQWSLDNMAECFLGHTAKVPLKKHPQWSNGKWKFKDRDIHYAANDVIGLAYIYDKLKYIYKLKF